MGDEHDLCLCPLLKDGSFCCFAVTLASPKHGYTVLALLTMSGCDQQDNLLPVKRPPRSMNIIWNLSRAGRVDSIRHGRWLVQLELVWDPVVTVHGEIPVSPLPNYATLPITFTPITEPVVGACHGIGESAMIESCPGGSCQ